MTLFLFGPRLVLAAPLLVLLPAAAVLDRRMLLALAATAAVAAGPLFGFNVPWRRLAAGPARGPRLRVATWNVGDGVPSGAVRELLAQEHPDFLALQECCEQPLDVPPGWRVERGHSWAFLSRVPITRVAERDPTDVWQLAGSGVIVRYTLSTSLGTLDVTNVHLETPREGLEAILHERLAGVPALLAKNEERDIEGRLARAWVDASGSPLRVVVGDFNTPVESSLFAEHWRGLLDCHSLAGWGFGFTKHTRHIGARIDHVLVAPGLRCLASRVGAWRAGDHAPVIAEIGLVAG